MASWSAISTAIGPLVGGWIVDATSWRFMFVVVVPFAIAGAIATTLAGRAIKEKAPAGERIDYAGAALITLGLGGVVGALILGPAQGFVALYPAALGITGIVLLTVFVVVEYRTRHRFYHSMLSPRGNSPASMQ